MRLSPREGATAKRPDIVARSEELNASGQTGLGFRTLGDSKPNGVMVAKGAALTLTLTLTLTPTLTLTLTQSPSPDPNPNPNPNPKP